MNSSARRRARVHLDAALDERGADRVLRRERVAAGRDDLGAGLAQREHEAGGLGLEVHDDRERGPRSAPSASRSASSRCSTGMCCRAHSMRRCPSGASDGSAMRVIEWRGPDLNRRHHGFQPCALPTELPRPGVRDECSRTKRDVRTGVTASRTSLSGEPTTVFGARQGAIGPDRTRRSGSTTRSAARARPGHASSGTRSASRHRGCTRSRRPPGAVTRASSSKNGIMLFIVDQLERPVDERKRRRVGDLVALASESSRGAGPRSTISATRRRHGRRASGQRAAARLATAPLPVPRSSTRPRRLPAPRRARRASAEANLVDARRVPLGREPVEVLTVNGLRKILQVAGCARRRASSIRMNHCPALIRLRDPELVAEPDTPVSRAASPRLIASVMRPYESSKTDQLARRCVGERLGDDGVVAVERRADLDPLAVANTERVEVLGDTRWWRRCRTDRRPARSRRSASGRPAAPGTSMR